MFGNYNDIDYENASWFSENEVINKFLMYERKVTKYCKIIAYKIWRQVAKANHKRSVIWAFRNLVNEVNVKYIYFLYYEIIVYKDIVKKNLLNWCYSTE